MKRIPIYRTEFHITFKKQKYTYEIVQNYCIGETGPRYPQRG